MFTAVRVVEVIPGKGLAPVLQHPHQAPVSNFLLHHIFGQESQAATGDGCAQGGQEVDEIGREIAASRESEVSQTAAI